MVQKYLMQEGQKERNLESVMEEPYPPLAGRLTIKVKETAVDKCLVNLTPPGFFLQPLPLDKITFSNNHYFLALFV